MKRTEETQVLVWYASEVHPEIRTQHEDLAKVIEWADANPKVWRIVRENKSKAFGRESSTYLGCHRGPSPFASLDRAAEFKRTIENDEGLAPAHRREEFWTWRAGFTLEHYGEKGFKGGLFQQFDGTYDRGCCYIDYTPETLDEVINRFVQWCGATFATKEVRIDGKTVRTSPETEATCPACGHFPRHRPHTCNPA